MPTFLLPDQLALSFEYKSNTQATQTLLFLNGLFLRKETWFDFAKFFEANYNLLFVDMISQGASDDSKEERSFAQNAEDCIHLLNYLNIKEVIICGISYGASNALNILRLFPQRVEAIIAISPVVLMDAYTHNIMTNWLQTIQEKGIEALLPSLVPQCFGKKFLETLPFPLEVLHIPDDAILTTQLSSCLQLSKRILDTPNFIEEFTHTKTKQKVLILCGKEDQICLLHTQTALAEALPTSTLIIYPEIGHSVISENFEQTVEDVKEWLRSFEKNL